MKCSHLTTILVSLALTGCALTPAQKAQREAEKIKAQQLLSIELAKQCDAETASLMEQKLNPPVSQTAEEKEKLDKAYAEKIQNPIFQACHKIAWDSYKAQSEVEEMQQYYRFERPYWGSPWHYCYICW